MNDKKKDVKFSSMLDCVRLGNADRATVHTLSERVIDVSVAEKFDELGNSGLNPVCLFSTRKACHEVNQVMLGRLASDLRVIVCKDDIDETKGTYKWNQKATEQLEKLNQDCNNTAGLEAKLTMAVGARVMLRRNIDTKAGLVNGAIGTVTDIFPRSLTASPTRITVKFDHRSEA